jgi:hypothetical protein
MLVDLTDVLAAGLVGALTGLALKALSVALRKPRLLPERVEPAVVAERLAAKVEAHPHVAFSERHHGVPVAVWPAFPVGFVAKPEWRVLVGVELESVADVDGIRAVVADRLAALEAERARVVR